jgi:anti-sigma factor RsiW
MRCEQAQALLTDYANDRLDMAELAAFETHLSACEACTKEATGIRQLANRIGSDLKDWIDQGAMPPELTRRIEAEIHALQPKMWWQHWAFVSGAAAAAAFLILFISARSPLGQQLATVPLLGTMVAPFQSNNQAATPINVSFEQDRVTLTVVSTLTTRAGTTILYTFSGKDLTASGDFTPYVPQLQGPSGVMKLKNLTSLRQGDQVVLNAFFEPAPFGVKLSLSVASLPNHTGSWQVSFQQ